jgi:gliding motility-associated-like protein
VTYWKKNIILVYFLASCLHVLSQHETDHWVQAGMHLKFSGNFTPTIDSLPLLSSLDAEGGATAASDKNGNLLFYSDGTFVYNRQYQKMPGCGLTGLLGPGSGGNEFSSQAALVVPYPGNDSLYILFHIFYGFSSNYNSFLYYSLIDMRAQNGLGDVVLANQLLLGGTQIQLKLTSVLHCNKKHIWVLGHLRNSDQYCSLLVTESGINPTPVYSAATMISEPAILGNDYFKGCMKVSPQADRVTAAYMALDSVEYCDFNNQTGVIANPRWLGVKPVSGIKAASTGPFGVEFSPSGYRLYVSANYKITNLTGLEKYTAFLYQFNTSFTSVSNIQSSIYMIDSIWNANMFAIQMAGNGRMYVNGYDGFFHSIRNPEGLNAACNYVQSEVLQGYYEVRLSGINLPVFLQSYFRYPIIATNNCQFQNISFSIQNTVGVSSVNWDFGDPVTGVNNFSNSYTPTHIFSQPGSYRVRLVVIPSNGCANDTLYKIVHAGELKVFLGNDTAFCNGDTLRLKLTNPVPYATYQWSTGSADSSISVSQSGQYWVKVFAGDCYAIDTINITVRNLPQFTLGNDTAICGNQPYALQPQPGYPNANYLWNTNATTSSIVAANPGSYWLRLTDQYGCSYRDSVNVSFKTLPSFNLGNDTALCQGQTHVLKANVSATAYLWNTGAASQQINATQTGFYWCDATLNGCTYRDSIFLLFKPLPQVQLGPDTTICEDVQYPLNVVNPAASYLWQDGKTTPDYTVSQPGTYHVKVTMNGCSASDTVEVKYNLKPRVNLGPDLSYCPGMQITLKPELQYVQSLIWQNGSTAPVYIATQSGLYYITATNYCGSKSDSVVVAKGVCKLYLPSAFTPNGDGVNDVFKAQYGDGITEFEMSIYNRWGQRVFYSTDKHKGWDGFVNGKLQAGVYIWYIRFRDSSASNGQIMKGTVVLIR